MIPSELTKSANEQGIIPPSVIFRYPYLDDERFIQSPLKGEIEALKLSDLTAAAASQAIRELDIKRQITITTTLPRNEKENHFIIPSLGIGGRAVSPTEVELYFDVSHPRVVQSLTIWKARQVGHELNHIARSQAKGMRRTLLDAVVSEGLATYYEEHWGGEYLPTPWGHKLSDTELETAWTQARSNLNETDFNHRSWFFGAGGEHPVWTGYSLGTRIVETFFQKHPTIQMREAVTMDSLRIAEDSGYMKR